MLTRRTRRTLRSGFTLVEALVATLTVAIVAGAVLTAVIQGRNAIQGNRLALLAKTALSQQMEMLRNRPFSQIAALSPTNVFAPGFPEGTGVICVCNYNPSTRTCDANGDPNLKRVTITVSIDPSRTWRLVNLFSNS